MRCFIAVDLPEVIKDKLFNLQKKLSGDAKIKWVAKKNLHLTLKFLGDIAEKRLEQIKEKLKEIKFKSFKVELDSLGVFPDEDYIRVIWVGLKPAGKVIELQQKVDSTLLGLGFEKDQRFHSHLTLGRVKFVKNKENLKEKLKLKIKGGFEIKNFKLMKSELTKDGPVYGTLETY